MNSSTFATTASDHIDSATAILKEILYEIEQPFQEGFAPGAIGDCVPRYYLDLTEVEQRRRHTSWTYALMTTIEKRFGLGGLTYQRSDAEFQEKCWIVIVPLYYKRLLEGFFYVYHTYYEDSRGNLFLISDSEDQCLEEVREDVEQFGRDQLERDLKELRAGLWKRAPSVGYILHTAKEVEFLAKVATNISDPRLTDDLHNRIDDMARDYFSFEVPMQNGGRRPANLLGASDGQTALQLAVSYGLTMRSAAADVKRRTLEGGTKAAQTSLAARNLAHHFASHVMYWLEVEARQIGKGSRAFPRSGDYFSEQADFYAYMRERMGLVTAFAIYLPHWTKTFDLGSQDITFRKNFFDLPSSIRRTIARTEGARWIDVVCECPTGTLAAIPGGMLGRQAFCGIVENVARDAAKYGKLLPKYVILVGIAQSMEQKFETDAGICILTTGPSWNTEVVDKVVKCLSQWEHDGQVQLVVAKKCDDNEQFTIRQNLSFKQDVLEKASPLCQLTAWEVFLPPKDDNNVCPFINDVFEKPKVGLDKNLQAIKKAFLSVTIHISQIDDSDLVHLSQEERIVARDNLLAVVVHDDRTPADIKHNLQARLEELDLCDELGHLRPGNWGVKERHIFASYLRGQGYDSLLSDHLPVMQLTDVGNSLGWKFFIQKPKDLLVVSNKPDDLQIAPSADSKVDLWTWPEFMRAAKHSVIRHQIAVLDLTPSGTTSAEIPWDTLPYRTLIAGAQKFEAYPTIELRDFESLSLESAYSRWLQFVCEERVQCEIPTLIGFNLTDQDADTDTFLKEHPECLQPLVFYDRHGDLLSEKGQFMAIIRRHPRTHYEPYEGGWDAENWFNATETKILNREVRLQEAGLLRLLIVDERLDPALDDFAFSFGAQEGKLTARQLWQHKGVTVSGREFEGGHPPTENLLFEWLSKQQFDFVLIHQGIIDKIHNHHHANDDRSCFTEELIERIYDNTNIWHVLIHSDRGGVTDLPTRVRFLNFSTLEAWFNNNVSKASLIDELFCCEKT